MEDKNAPASLRPMITNIAVLNPFAPGRQSLLFTRGIRYIIPFVTAATFYSPLLMLLTSNMVCHNTTRKNSGIGGKMQNAIFKSGNNSSGKCSVDFALFSLSASYGQHDSTERFPEEPAPSLEHGKEIHHAGHYEKRFKFL